jgi:hypothetical protein
MSEAASTFKHALQKLHATRSQKLAHQFQRVTKRWVNAIISPLSRFRRLIIVDKAFSTHKLR